jgi:hypothetical protein
MSRLVQVTRALHVGSRGWALDGEFHITGADEGAIGVVVLALDRADDSPDDYDPVAFQHLDPVRVAGWFYIACEGEIKLAHIA